MKKIMTKSLAVFILSAVFNLITFAQTAERIKIAKGETDAEVSGNLASKRSKKYVAYVQKGFMTCITLPDSIDSKIVIKLNGKVFNSDNGPCSKHAQKSGDQYIEVYNSANKKVSFNISVGFYEHG